jgi:hypothetical protein
MALYHRRPAVAKCIDLSQHTMDKPHASDLLAY